MSTTTNPVLCAMLKASAELESTDQSPLAEVDPNSLQLLWDRINEKIYDNMPEAITDEDLMPMCLELRRNRLAHTDKREKAAATRQRNKKEKSTPITQQIIQTDVSIDDLL
jgi:hypothetical protein